MANVNAYAIKGQIRTIVATVLHRIPEELHLEDDNSARLRTSPIRIAFSSSMGHMEYNEPKATTPDVVMVKYN